MDAGRLQTAICIREWESCNSICSDRWPTVFSYLSSLSHGEDPEEDYVVCLAKLGQRVRAAKKSHSNVFVGLDANAVLGQQSEHDDLRFIGKWGLGNRNERGKLFAGRANAPKLVATNTQKQKRCEQQWTHQQWSTGARRQIDFIMCTYDLLPALDGAFVNDCGEFGSDRGCVVAEFMLEKCRHAEKETEPEMLWPTRVGSRS